MGQRNMSRFVAFAAIVACASAAPANTGSAFVYGHAAYTYGPLHCSADQCAVMPSCNKAHWKPAIGAFNEAASSDASKIKTIYSYGGDVEFWPINSGSGNDTQSCWAPASDNCNYTSYFEENNHNAAVTYKSTSGVEQVVALLDARMDGWDMITHYNNFDACNFGVSPTCHDNLSLESPETRGFACEIVGQPVRLFFYCC